MGEIIQLKRKKEASPAMCDFVSYRGRKALLLGTDETENGGEATIYLLDSKSILPVPFSLCTKTPLDTILSGLIGLMSITPRHFAKRVVHEWYRNNMLHVILIGDGERRESSYIPISELSFISPFWSPNQTVSKGT